MKSIKKQLTGVLKSIGIREKDRRRKFYATIFRKYAYYTMNPEKFFICNLELVERFRGIPGDIVECGVWRGGMIAGIAELLGDDRHYFLYDSFEGLPEAKPIDGQSAIDWQQNINDPSYHNNCSAEIEFADRAMKLSGVKQYALIPGWFNETVRSHHSDIAILRLDGDWYESTMDCLKALYPKVVYGGIIILDDYYYWEGCSKATHDYLSSIQSPSRIYKAAEDIAYIIKLDTI